MYLLCCALETNNCLINLDNENGFSFKVSPGFDAVRGSTLLFRFYPQQQNERPPSRESFPGQDEEVLAPPHPTSPTQPTGSYKSSFTAQHPSWFQVINYENYIPRLPPPPNPPAKSRRPDLLTTGWICKIERGYITFHLDSSAYRNAAEQQELLMFDKVNIHCHYRCRGNRQRVSRGSELEMETQAAYPVFGLFFSSGWTQNLQPENQLENDAYAECVCVPSPLRFSRGADRIEVTRVRSTELHTEVHRAHFFD